MPVSAQRLFLMSLSLVEVVTLVELYKGAYIDNLTAFAGPVLSDYAFG